MASWEAETTVRSYSGQDEYVFVCYSHRDNAEVFKYLAWLKSEGVNAWFDEGIHPGKQWRAEIAERIKGADKVIYFVSDASVASEHCRREIVYALDRDQQILPVFIEQTELEPEIELGLSGTQSIHSYQLSKDELEAKLASALKESHPLFLHARKRSISRWVVPAGLITLAFAFALFLRFQSANQQAPPQQSVRPMEEKAIAVLPFENLNSDPETRFFGDGVAEQVITLLVRHGSTPVIGSMSSFQFRGTTQSPQEIGRILSVSHLLRGSISVAGATVRVTAQLIDARNGFLLWTDSFDRKLSDVFAIQDEIASVVSNKVSQQVSGSDSVVKIESEEISTEVWSLYLHARATFTELGPKPIEDGIRRFEELVLIAPDFADAWYGLARARSRARGIERDRRESTRTPLEMALRLEPDHPQALAMMSEVLAYNDFNWITAREMIERAASLAPNDAEVQRRYAWHLRIIGGQFKGLEVSRKAYRLDPLSRESVEHLTQLLQVLGDGEEALLIWQKYYASAKQISHIDLAHLLRNLAQLEEAETHINLARNRWGDDDYRIQFLRYSYARQTGDANLETSLRARLMENPRTAGSFAFLDKNNPLPTFLAALEQRRAYLIQLLYYSKPFNLPEEAWTALKRQTNFHQIRAKCGGSSFYRCEEEKNDLLKKVIDWNLAEDRLGKYGSPTGWIELFRLRDEFWLRFSTGGEFRIVQLDSEYWGPLDFDPKLKLFPPTRYVTRNGKSALEDINGIVTFKMD